LAIFLVGEQGWKSLSPAQSGLPFVVANYVAHIRVRWAFRIVSGLV
jgi:hypothetical protein